VLAGLFSTCSIYTGLKVGLVINMSITAALLGWGTWTLFDQLQRVAGLNRRPFGLLENNISQTAASAGASVASAGLVAPIPALTLLTGQVLDWPRLAAWIFAVCLVGIVVAIGLRRQLVLVDRLPFAVGIAAAQTLRELHSASRAAAGRIVALLGSAVIAATLYLLNQLEHVKAAVNAALTLLFGHIHVAGYTPRALTFGLDSTLALYAIGALIGPRVCVSLTLGAALAWGVLAPALLHGGLVAANAAGQPDPRALTAWLIWPGVTLMVVAALVSFCFSWRSFATAFRMRGNGADVASRAHEVPAGWFALLLASALIAASALQIWLFGIVWWIAVLGVLLSFVLAIVAARVAGETGVTPVAPLGKVTQLLFGALKPGFPAANLMTANVTGGAASQCAELLADFKCGWLVGASSRWQVVAQLVGVAGGATVGAAAYRVLIPHPQTELLTPAWPAPGVAGWKAVAELFQNGWTALPPGTALAMAIAAGAAIVLALGEKLAPPRARRWIPSAASIGMAFVMPASNSLTMLVGALVAAGLTRKSKGWASRYLLALCAGVIAGESLTGVAAALTTALSH
jgi:putative OPT family oligopeptide transporter